MGEPKSLLTVEQGVTNAVTAPLSVEPVAQLYRTNKTAALDSFNVHAGPFGAFDEVVSFGPDYDELAEARTTAMDGAPNWIGFTDIYWMSTLIPDKAPATSDFRSMGKGIFLANLFYSDADLAPGQQLRAGIVGDLRAPQLSALRPLSLGSARGAHSAAAPSA